jgi:hypothetical protein
MPSKFDLHRRLCCVVLLNNIHTGRIEGGKVFCRTVESEIRYIHVYVHTNPSYIDMVNQADRICLVVRCAGKHQLNAQFLSAQTATCAWAGASTTPSHTSRRKYTTDSPGSSGEDLPLTATRTGREPGQVKRRIRPRMEEDPMGDGKLDEREAVRRMDPARSGWVHRYSVPTSICKYSVLTAERVHGNEKEQPDGPVGKAQSK